MLGNILAGKGIVRAGSRKYYQDEPRFNSVFSINNLPQTIKDGAYLINLYQYAE